MTETELNAAATPISDTVSSAVEAIRSGGIVRVDGPTCSFSLGREASDEIARALTTRPSTPASVSEAAVTDEMVDAAQKVFNAWGYSASKPECLRAALSAALASTAETVSREEYDDKVDGLTADLESAVEVAYRRGATEWVRLNYPKQYAALRSRATEERDDG